MLTVLTDLFKLLSRLYGCWPAQYGGRGDGCLKIKTPIPAQTQEAVKYEPILVQVTQKAGKYEPVLAREAGSAAVQVEK